jgi:hypothetical protein
MANALGLAVNLVPDDPEDCLEAMQQLATGSGLGRIKPGVFAPAEDETPDDDSAFDDRDIWNPDGRPGAGGNWFGFFADLFDNGDGSELSDAIR